MGVSARSVLSAAELVDPANWQATSQDPGVQAKLATNVFRSVTLLEHERAVA